MLTSIGELIRMIPEIMNDYLMIWISKELGINLPSNLVGIDQEIQTEELPQDQGKTMFLCSLL